MKISELNNYLTGYIANNDIKSLLINGKWGIGKTYTITQFLKNIKSNKDVTANYYSLFGCTDIDTLHQQLYAKFHPHKVRGLKALSYVPLALNLTATVGFETGIDSAKIASDISASQINKSIKVNEKTCLVIFDDLERIANNSTIRMEELLGYFNRLRSENIKIIVLCNEEEIKGENKNTFNTFKEKVFDRSINIEECDNAVIQEFFGDNYKFLKNETLDLIDNNLRTAYKISIFVNEASEFLKSNNIKVDTEDLLLVCASIVAEFFSKIPSEKYKEKLNEDLKNNDSYFSVHAHMELEKQLSDEFIVTAISRYIAEYSIFLDGKIINSLYRLFVYLDSNSIDKKVVNNNKFNEDKIFYLSDENKVKYIENKIKLLNDKNLQISDAEIIKEIISWLECCTWYFTDEILTNVINRILELSENKTNKNIINAFLNHEYLIDNKNTTINQFYNLFKTKNRQRLENWCIDYFKNTVANLNNFSNQLARIERVLEQNNLNVPKALADLIVKNNFYIPDLSKDINYNLWDFCHSMCYFVVNKMPDQKEVLRNYLLSLKENNKDSKCLSERVQSLIKYKIDGKRND